MKIAVVGATGMVGQVMLKVLEEQNIKPEILIPVASALSLGKMVQFNGAEHLVVSVEKAIEMKPDIAIFSAGGSTSLKYAPEFAKNGCFVIDNSSAWRMDKNVPLVVPEINAHTITPYSKIIANPNCSTIQMVMALAPIHSKFGIERLVVSTYQSVTGTGVKGLAQLEGERKGKKGLLAYPHRIDLNLLPHGGDFLENGYTTEEMKLVNETRKILGDNEIRITATVVRVPVKGGHSESVNVKTKLPFTIDEIYQGLTEMPGVKVLDEPKFNIYPMPFFAEGKDEVFVGRIRVDESEPNSLNLWVVSDNLRKGAATNAVQIAKYLIEKGLV